MVARGRPEGPPLPTCAGQKAHGPAPCSRCFSIIQQLASPLHAPAGKRKVSVRMASSGCKGGALSLRCNKEVSSHERCCGNPRAVQTVRPGSAGQPSGSHRAGGGGLWISGPQRGGQIHHPQAASGAGQAHGRGNRRLWAAHGSPHPHGDSQAGGQPDREPQLLRPPDRRGEPAHRPNPARGAGAGHRGGAAHRPAGRPEGQADGPLLPGHEAAAGPGRRPAGLPQAADPGRAHQRPGPGGHQAGAGSAEADERRI